MSKENFDEMITFIYVSDLENSRMFYEEMLKFPLRLDQGSCRIVETNKGGGGLLGYCVRDQNSDSANNLIITLVTSKVDEWYEYLINNGVQVPEPPSYNQRYKIYHFFFFDPDGYKLEIQDFRDPVWYENLEK